MKFILLKLDELKNADTNKVVLIDFLNAILSAINGSLGGISKLETTLNETTVIIRDGNPLPDIKNVISVMKEKSLKKYEIYQNHAQFDLYGYSTTNPLDSIMDYGGKGHASFIKDFSFTTEITPALSTMLTVGATANSTVVGENSTAFSKFNAGLTDRYKEKIVYLKDDGTSDTENYTVNTAYQQTGLNAGDTSTPESRAKIREKENEKKIYMDLYLKYASTYNSYKNYIKSLAGTSPTYNGEADTYKDALINFITYKQQADFSLRASLAKQDPTKYLIFTPSTGFIPFNMSLTMDGLSGMKIYSKFYIDTTYLPANYPDNADFLIKNINHNISNNKWTTKLESVVISQSGDQESKGKVDIFPNGQNTPSQQSAYADGGTIVPSSDKVGAQPYSASEVAKSLTAKGQQNGLLNINDPLVLEKLMFLPPSADKTYYPDRYWRLHPSAAKAYLLFYNAAKSAGYNWTLSSAYRSKQHQASLGSGTTVASPGSSPHGLGGAVEISELYLAVGGSGDPFLNSSARQNNPLYKWMSENGPKFGWHNPNRLADKSGVAEIWHWEYWGLI